MSPIIRIALRYVAGYLAFKGLISLDMGADLASDPDVIALVEMGIGGAVAATVEGWYWLAKKLGWRT